MASAAAAIARAIQASGVIVKLEPQQFQQVVSRSQGALIVQSYSNGVFGGGYQYLFSYKGLAFHTKSKERLNLPGSAEIIEAKSIWVP